MKRKLFIALSAVLISTGLMAGGINTNTNQSAAYARMLARNACLGIDAVYYNPAGLTKLSNGFHLSLNNQSIFQTKDVVNNYKYLHNSPNATYTGNVKAPLFPGVYAVYKMDKLAFSFGFNPVGGGGGATYDTGLPSFEMGIADLVPLLNSKGFPTTQYSADINFEGTSVFFGYQAGVSYEINDMISVYGGLRYVTAKNTYKGSILNIMVNPNYPNFGATFTGGMVKASSFFTAGAATLNALAGGAKQYATGITAAITAGTPAATPLTAMPQQTQDDVAKILGAAGISSAGMNIGTAAATLNAVAPAFTLNANTLKENSDKTEDVEVDATQKGTGFTPIIGANITLAEKLTIAIKYEFLTKIELTNHTTKDVDSMFVDGAKTRSDMPALLSIGASYPVTNKLSASLGFNYYWDKNADYGKKDAFGVHIANDQIIDKNYYELALGLEYNITEKFLVSAGFQTSQTGVSKNYQDDLNYNLSANTVGFGGKYMITPKIGLNLGGLFTKYADDNKTFNHMLGTNIIPVTETYSESTWLVAVGLDFKIGK